MVMISVVFNHIHGLWAVAETTAFMKDKSLATLPEILGLLTQHYQKSGEPIRLLILADHVVRIALPKRTLESCD